MGLKVVILAAGMGSRMKSQIPKVLHRIGGLPMIEHVIRVAQQLNPEEIYVVYGHGAEQVQSAMQHHTLRWIHQSELLGTGHAVQQVLPYINAQDQVLTLYGDVPLIQCATLQALLDQQKQQGAALLSIELKHPTGYGRLIYEDDTIAHIIEEKDATDAQRLLQEVNTGICAVNGQNLKDWLSQLDNKNAQKEYYLTDIVHLAYQAKTPFTAIKVHDPMEVSGVNQRKQQAELERTFQKRMVDNLMEQGVAFADPARFDVRGTVEVGEDVSFDINVICEGQVKIGSRVKIGAHVILRDCEIADDVVIHPMSFIEASVIGQHCDVGPYARLRPKTHLAGQNKIGNFVEIKASSLNKQTKVNHLSYIGDSHIGQSVNIGAGTITCNYDGAQKHQTHIEDDVFVGSNTQLVAPVCIKKGATIGAGSTITKDVTSGALALTRPAQKEIKGWQRPSKKRLDVSKT